MGSHWSGVILQDMELMPVLCFSACYDRVWEYGHVNLDPIITFLEIL